MNSCMRNSLGENVILRSSEDSSLSHYLKLRELLICKKYHNGIRTFISGTIWFISAVCYEGSENHGFNMFPCIFSLARGVSDFAIQERTVSLCSFTSVPREPEGSGFGPIRQGSPGTLSLLKSHWPLLTDWESELRFLLARFRGRDVQKPLGYFTLCSPCLFLPPP